MDISDRGLDLIKRYEGLRLTAYDDGTGTITIGYGHVDSDLEPGDTITQDHAEKLLRQDVAEAEQAVDELIDAPLSQAQFDALVSFTFNVGRGALLESDLREAVNARDHTTVAMELPRWRRAGGRKLLGLSRRRIDEADLYLSDVN